MALENRERIDALLTQANTLSRDIHEQRIQEMANVNAGGGGGIASVSLGYQTVRYSGIAPSIMFNYITENRSNEFVGVDITIEFGVGNSFRARTTLITNSSEIYIAGIVSTDVMWYPAVMVLGYERAIVYYNGGSENLAYKSGTLAVTRLEILTDS